MIRNTLLLPILAATVVACNSGNNAVPTPTPYLFSNMVLQITDQTNCSPIGAGFEVQCQTESSALTFNITYTAQPASYMLIPTLYPLGVSESQSGECGVHPALNYSCSVTLVANNAESGVVNFFLDGSLGQRNFITVTYE